MAEPGVLGDSQCLPGGAAMLLLETCHLLVWMGSMDLLEYSKLLQLSSTLLHSHVAIPGRHVTLYTANTCFAAIQVFRGKQSKRCKPAHRFDTLDEHHMFVKACKSLRPGFCIKLYQIKCFGTVIAASCHSQLLQCLTLPTRAHMQPVCWLQLFMLFLVHANGARMWRPGEDSQAPIKPAEHFYQAPAGAPKLFMDGPWRLQWHCLIPWALMQAAHSVAWITAATSMASCLFAACWPFHCLASHSLLVGHCRLPFTIQYPLSSMAWVLLLGFA